MAADKKRFADLTDNDIGKIIEEKDAANTKRSIENSVRLFRKYLLEKGKGADFENGDDLCPVRTFVRHKRKLNPKCVFLFQRPSSNPKADVWYDNCPVGDKKLAAIMSTISAEFGLSKSYTNHSLRATLVHILDAANFAGRHIMCVTGHKSETSLKTYTGYTDAGTKDRMSKALSESTRPTPRYSESTSTSSRTFTGSATASNTD
ncbi:hypothetical protein FSP39_016762 [Pinctada imbricata]|uniref:Tyr recombinase domain-containing protein n=1 Tax=Pinctada imbricata TaxID=66713 RepID=A0AA88XRR4_PINIB|nr:hypothetical protein FSP39_016762 [Pinctada imbricata]